MKAICLHHRGGPEQLVYEEAPRPVLQHGDALVRVLASATTRNELDWDPTYNDQQGNSRLPSIPGHELCGIVEALAPDVRDLAVGDAVYGLTSFFRDGTAAEYVAVQGAGRAIDYKTQQFDELISDVDVVLDTVGGETQDRSWKVLKKGGILVTIAGESIRQPDPKYGVKGIFFIVKPDRKQLTEIGSLFDQGFIKPVIAAVLPLQQARQAFEQALGHGKQGKIVLNVHA